MKKLGLTILVLGLAIQAALSNDRPSSLHGDLAARARAVLAQTSGRIELDGLQKTVEVIRDRWGVAHIYAQTQEDLFFAQGFVAAQDRLWQMEIWRRTGEGRLAEVLGESAIERDKFARLMRYRGNMEAEWSSYAPDAKRIIESFVRGINAFIEMSRDRLPIEFQLTGIKPEPWTPEVCLTRMAGYVMTRNASAEVFRAELARQFGAEKVDQWIETDPFKKLVLPAGLDLNGIDTKILSGAKAASEPVSFAPGANATSRVLNEADNLASDASDRTRDEGSNNWVVSGALSVTGKPLLANDPHRPILLPSLRYMVHLVGPGWNVIGAGEPTLPGVAAGHNERVGFGFTIVGIDQQDLYVEQTDQNYPTVYRYMGKLLRMRVEREKIKVKGRAEPVDVELKFTRHGPVIYEDPQLHRAYALKWIGSEPGSAGYLASLSLNRAKNWAEFLKALERWKVPSENLVYADIDGNIGWQAAGSAPVRRGWSGLLPVPGDSGRYEWEGFLPLSELPRAYNPAKNFIATANHKVIPEGYKHEINFEWSAPYRFNRIEEVLSKGAKFSVDDFKRLQHDEASLPARELVSLLVGLKIDDPMVRDARNLLVKWNKVLSRDSRAALLYEMWLRKLVPAFASLVVPPEAWPSFREGVSLTITIRALTAADPKIFGANPQAKRDEVLVDSLVKTVRVLRGTGVEMKDWRWGDLHQAKFNHPLSTDEAIGAVFDLKSVARGGDENTVNATAGRDFVQQSGASFREILDLSDWDNSVAINVPGQSGQPTSPHYGDLLPLWAEGKYFPLLFSRDKVEKNASERLVLEPRAGGQGKRQ
ncbi:MAG TPA: penicillin acylase family protein [Blastocatellia bacterium]|nr:penicillin acylase family protein [Blastocatellia bacterium]